MKSPALKIAALPLMIAAALSLAPGTASQARSVETRNFNPPTTLCPPLPDPVRYDDMARSKGKSRPPVPAPPRMMPIVNVPVVATADAIAVQEYAAPAGAPQASPPAPPPAPPVTASKMTAQSSANATWSVPSVMPMPSPARNTENYRHFDDNAVQRTTDQPVSTFSIDVDTGSYANVRSMLCQRERPPADSVRVEEFLNYFHYGYAKPASAAQPFSVSTQLTAAPWNGGRQLMMIGLQGYEPIASQLPPANLVFLVDTSGSMGEPDKLPLVQETLRILTKQLRPQDKVSIVVYAGSAGLVLPPTSGKDKATILAALDRLEAGGSTNGGEGIDLAYKVARENKVDGGINRVILATDGDFNVGDFGVEALKTRVADQRKSGVALSTLGFGRGNYNDEMAEQLADIGDGQHAYIDSVYEARRVMQQQLSSSLLTIAKDVKIQIEFNPAYVREYRLIGYTNRILNEEDFSNDQVDAGEIGAGHRVTAVYEITPVDSGDKALPDRRYQSGGFVSGVRNGEIATLQLRYKLPGSQQSTLISTPVKASQLDRGNDDTRFAGAVIAYADLLRNGGQVGNWDWNRIASEANAATGSDRDGSRRQFVELVRWTSNVVNAP